MSPALTRRGLVQAGAVTLGATVVGIPGSARAIATDPDAVLLDLIRQHVEAMAALDALDVIADPLRTRFEAEAPERPKALLWRPGDFSRTSYGVGASDLIADMGVREYGFRGVEWLRKTKPAGHWPAASEARRREIVEAHDAWMAERQVQADRIGLTTANDACDRASDLIEEVEGAIMDHVPVTLAGFRAKARWIASTKQAEEWAVVLLRDLCGVTS